MLSLMLASKVQKVVTATVGAALCGRPSFENIRICHQRAATEGRPTVAPLKKQSVEADLVVDVSDHGERVGAGDEVLHDDDCCFSTYSLKTAGAALEHHVSGRDSSSKIHTTILDNCRKTIAVGTDVRNFAGHKHDVRVIGVRHELNLATTTEQSQVSPVA